MDVFALQDCVSADDECRRDRLLLQHQERATRRETGVAQTRPYRYFIYLFFYFYYKDLIDMIGL